MTQRERDRLMVLKKAQKKLITQRQAAEELKLSERQVRRMLVRLKEVGNRAVVHGLRARPASMRAAVAGVFQPPSLPLWAAARIDRTRTSDKLED